MTDSVIVRMESVTKSFPGVLALDKVSLSVGRGEVHALIGENGAGKSTLMKILSGLYQPDSGKIWFDDQAVTIKSPSVSLKLGISMIYQELNPVLEMTIGENIFLHREPIKRGGLLVDFSKMYADTAVLLSRFHMGFKPRWKMNRLSTAQKQMVEIIKAVSLNSKVIVMDEPTSSLTDEEVTTLFAVIRELKSHGVCIIYISHRLEEVFQIADRFTVLRDGQCVGTDEVTNITKDRLIAMMVGRDLTNIFPKVESRIGMPVLQVFGLTRAGSFEDVSFEVRKGEILGFYGLMGAGRSEVMRAIFGVDRLDKGEIVLEGTRIFIRQPQDAIRHGIAMVTEDRKEMGLVLCRSVKENIVLANLREYSTGPFVRKAPEEKACLEIGKKLTIKMSGLQQLAMNLSGGNQQKVVLSKWLITRPKVIIMDEPTRGIDVAAKAEIHLLTSQLAQQGLAVILISSELPEILGMSDRVLVMGDGKIRGEFAREELKQDALLACALGGVSNVERK